MTQKINLEQAAQAALDAWEGWNGLGVAGRAQLLQNFVGQLSDSQARMAQWQIDQALRLIGGELELPGPTGESNVLYTSGRGLFICTSDENASEVAIIGQLVAALIAGNVVLLAPAPSHTGFCRYLLRLLVAGSCPAAVVQLIENSSLETLGGCPSIAGFACICSEAGARELNRRLVSRDGVLVQLVAETDPENLDIIGGEYYLSRFITESVRTTNTTAVGGNATLLELGGKAE
ncbi:1-pyrroline-5-carboxylate dehydrogenase [Marinobacterium aestuariivivens]|uniref:1-pyrroline-5-carboxylate dehydrogenase n=1 Tax=Marinobacterium aestuariivivens TaxID=1698799 RepID=A0ABW1ZYE9_9GAMM